MPNKAQESEYEKQTACLDKPHDESVVRAVMFAIVASILGSTMFSLVQCADKNVAKQEVFESSISCNCQEQVQSHFVQRTVQYRGKESPYPALLRALALLFFCAGYFGDEWLESNDDACPNVNADVRGNSRWCFALDFVGWLLISVQACFVGNHWLFAVLGTVAVFVVSVNVLRQTELPEKHKCWLCENLIWIVSLFLSISWAVNILVVSLLIMCVKTIGWMNDAFYRQTFKSKQLYYVLMFLVPIVLWGTRWIARRIY